MVDLKHFFTSPASPLQRQYEAVRAVIIDKLPISEVAQKYAYSVNTVYSLVRDSRNGKIQLFPTITHRGPKQRRTPPELRQTIIDYRKQKLSCHDIALKISQEGYKISKSTVENIVADADFTKLSRRTHEQRGLSRKNQLLPESAQVINIDELESFSYDVPVAGVFFFIPYIIESGILSIIEQCQLPESSVIKALHANLSLLLLKLMGSERLSHIEQYNHEPGLALFAGLTRLPKKSYLTSYSCRMSEATVFAFQKAVVTKFKETYPEFYKSEYINLDFHSIPHYGTESQMEKVWVGAKHQAMKGATTLLAQDSKSNVIVYTRSDILRKNEAQEIKHFVEYWQQVKGMEALNETLVFDCKLTSYTVLNELNQTGIKFITLRKRCQSLMATVDPIPESAWKKVYLPIPKRRHKGCYVYESWVQLKKEGLPVRQIIVKGHGRVEPTFIITNHPDLPLKEVLFVYAKRWHIENKLAELVTFFNLNALSSPIMIRIHFDMLWTIISDTLYHRLAQNLPRFEQEKAYTIFKRFIDMPGRIIYDGVEFILKIRKRAHAPILMGLQELAHGVEVPWLGNKRLRVVWSA